MEEQTETTRPSQPANPTTTGIWQSSETFWWCGNVGIGFITTVAAGTVYESSGCEFGGTSLHGGMGIVLKCRRSRADHFPVFASCYLKDLLLLFAMPGMDHSKPRLDLLCMH